MTMTATPGGFFIPPYFNRLGPAFGTSSIGLIDAAGERVGVVFMVPKTGTIDRLLFRTAAVTTSQSVDVALEGVSTTTGMPDGVNYGSSTPGVRASLAANTLYEVTLGTGATVTVGNIVAMVVDWTSTVGNANMGAMGGTRDMNAGFPYGVLYTSSWAKQSDMNMTPIVGVRYSDGTYEWVGGVLAGAVSQVDFNSGSTPDEVGNKYVLNVPLRCSGFWLATNPASGSSTFDVVLYNSSDTVLASVSVDPDQLGGVGAVKLINMRWAPQSLAIGSYRLVLKPTSANNVNYVHWVALSNAQLACNPSGQNVYKTSRTDAAGWTDATETVLPMMGLYFDQVDDGVSAGGGVGPRILTPVGGGGAYF